MLFTKFITPNFIIFGRKKTECRQFYGTPRRVGAKLNASHQLSSCGFQSSQIIYLLNSINK